VSWAPNAIDDGEADSVIAAGACVTVKLEPVAPPAVWLLSPEYAAVTAYVPGASVADVWQLDDASVAMQSVTPLDVNVTVPVAPSGIPDTDSVSVLPNATPAGAADSLNDVAALTTVKLAPVADAPVLFGSPE
jgi:hypothetical protein